MNDSQNGVTDNLIADAINAAEDIRDPLEGLVGKTTADPGAAFQPEVLERLATLRKDDRASFEALRAQLKKAGFRVDIDHADEQLGKRIRNAKTSKVPYVLVVGDDDVAHQSVGVNPRGGEVERDVSVVDFIARLTAEVAEGQLGDIDVS